MINNEIIEIFYNFNIKKCNDENIQLKNRHVNQKNIKLLDKWSDRSHCILDDKLINTK